MRLTDLSVVASTLLLITLAVGQAQSPSQRNPDVSNKALITKSTPGISTDAFKNKSADTPDALRKMADGYYAWRNENYPVRSSDAGLHTWDDRLTDYSPGKIAERAQHVHSLLEKVRAMKTDNWPKDKRIDWILFRAQLENVDFENRVLKFERINPQVYFGDCTNDIFFLLNIEDDTTRDLSLSASARFRHYTILLM